MNAGWNKGAHNVKFGIDVHRLHMNHYEITAPSFNFTGGATALNGGAAPNLFNGYADFLLGSADLAQHGAAESAARTRTMAATSSRRRCGSWEYGIYIRDQFQLTRKLTVSAGVRWEYYPVPQHADRGVEIFDFTQQPAAAVRARRHPDRLRHRGAEGSVHAAPRRRLPRRPTHWSSAPATRAIRRTTT